MRNQISIFLRPVIYYHTLYWIINVLLFTLIFWSGSENRGFWASLHENAAFLPFGLIFTYFSVNYLIPEFFFRNRIPLYILLQLVLLLLYPVASNLVKVAYISPVIYETKSSFSPYEGYLTSILILIFDIVPLAGVKILKQLRQDAVLQQKIHFDKTNAELKLKEAELKILKSQIHPHFLFNTLNNLYSLSLEKSEKTPDLIIKLADMLSYIIYECNSEKVALAKEISFIKSFLELQRVRYDNCNISFKIEGEIHDMQIAPMILHTFIDNCFKHGADKDSDNPWIDISIILDDRELLFEAMNSIRNENTSLVKNTGIGIENVKKRLELIYPGRHLLTINNSEDKYSVSLKMDLKKMDNRKTRCLIIDDEPLAIKLIRTHLSKIDSFEVVGECRNALKAVEYLKDGSVDLMFLDINMPEITGLDFLKTLQSPPYVIITTAYREYAIEGYDLDVVDFLLKPVSFERFLKAINRFCNRTRSQLNKDDKNLNQPDSGKCIHIQDGKNIFRLLYENILYFEGYGEYVKVNTTGKTYIVRDSLTEFENKLPPGNFTRIHKSYIINIQKVTGFSPIHVFLDKTELPVGRSHRDRVMGILRAEGKN